MSVNYQTQRLLNSQTASLFPPKLAAPPENKPELPPYNTRLLKKQSLPSQDKTPPPIPSPPASPTHQVMGKRSSVSELVSPAKKGPAASPVSVDAPKENTSIAPAFSPGLTGKAPTRALFKVARKGKNKLVSTVVATENETVKNGAFAKPPHHQ